jgi:hypothetical protein
LAARSVQATHSPCTCPAVGGISLWPPGRQAISPLEAASDTTRCHKVGGSSKRHGAAIKTTARRPHGDASSRRLGPALVRGFSIYGPFSLQRPDRADGLGQHAPERRAVACDPVPPVLPRGDHECRSSPGRSLRTLVRSAHGMHEVRNDRRRCPAELARGGEIVAIGTDNPFSRW